MSFEDVKELEVGKDMSEDSGRHFKIELVRYSTYYGKLYLNRLVRMEHQRLFIIILGVILLKTDIQL